MNYIRVPAGVLLDKSLTKTDILIYMGLVFFAGGKDQTHPSYETLSSFANCNRRTVSSSIRVLEEAGHVRIDSGWGYGKDKKTNTYHLLSPIFQPRARKTNQGTVASTQAKFVPKVKVERTGGHG